MRWVAWVVVLALWGASCGDDDDTPGEGEAEGEGEGEDPCLEIQCPPRSTCVDGSCRSDDPCVGVACEPGFFCSAGSCINEHVDEDGDGYPAEVDCDDHDPDVVPGSVRTCLSDCGEGTSTCAGGQWSECTAPTECTCQPGETRQEDCGRCGTASRPCGDDGEWGPVGPCVSEGTCSPGAIELEDCPGAACEQRSRTCGDDCEWGAFDECEGQDECAPDDEGSQACGNCGAQLRTCTGQCLWGAFGPCGGEGPCAPGQIETQDCMGGGEQTRTCDAACTWGAWSACPANECNSDNQCVAATCCHPSSCIPIGERPDCGGIVCTQDCRAGTMDCGQGHCECQSSACVAVIDGGI